MVYPQDFESFLTHCSSSQRRMNKPVSQPQVKMLQSKLYSKGALLLNDCTLYMCNVFIELIR